MKKIQEFTEKLHNANVASLLIRIALAAVFINAGWGKITNMAQVIAGFNMMGFGEFLAYFVSYAELICGVLMLIGLMVEYAGVLLGIIMAVAIIKVHGPNGFSMANGGYEYVFVLMLASFAMVALGAGDYSVCRLLKKKK